MTELSGRCKCDLLVPDNNLATSKLIPVTVFLRAPSIQAHGGLQVQRTNAVHPMIAKTSDETVRLSYLAFPYALQKIEQLRDWSATNPNVL
jgi:hypothetical protein